MIIFTLIGHKPLAYKNFHFPAWCDAIGWLLALSSVGMIPGMAIYQIATTPGTLYQVRNHSAAHSTRYEIPQRHTLPGTKSLTGTLYQVRNHSAGILYQVRNHSAGILYQVGTH